MKPRPLLWALLSLALFIAAAYFWHLGNQRAKRESSTVPKPGAQLESDAFRLVSGPPRAAGAAATPTNLTASVTNRFRYRLTNTTASLDQLSRNDNALLLRNAFIDTSVRGGLAIPAHLRAQGDAGSYLVQSRGVIADAFRKAIKAAGAETVCYVPNNAYLVRASAEVAKGLAALPVVQSVLPFEPYYKLDLSLLALAVEQQPLSAGARLNVLAFPGQRDRALAGLEAAGATLLQEERSPFGPLLTVQTRGGSVAELAQLPSVQVIEPFRERQAANDLARTRIGVTTNTLQATTPYLGLTGAAGLSGSNVIVQVADFGVWGGHPDLAGRVFGATNDNNGHGTHVAGTIASSGANSPVVPGFGTNLWSTVAPGSTNGADFRGMAPAASILSTGFGTDESIQRDAALWTNGRVLICNQSYTYGAPDYDLHAASFDSATRDALLDRTGPQPLLFVCAAGNIGGGDARGQGGFPDGIQSPGTAKNVLTVGAIDQFRRITNLVTEILINGLNLTTNKYAPWLDMTDSTNEVTFFSSRGNTGIGQEGTYGRFKPDVVAPGAMLISCSITNLPYPETPTNLYLTRNYPGVFARGGSTNNFSQAITLPTGYLISFTVTCTANAASPTPWPGVQVNVGMNNPPTQATGTDTATLANPPLANGTVRWTVVNPTSNNMSFDMTVSLQIVNPVVSDSYSAVLSNLNETLDPNHLYRYEWGSSMAAAVVSGQLALMEEYFARDLGITNESPALMKALVINGARNLSLAYDYDAQATANKQGWGLVDIRSTLPAQPASTGSQAAMQFIDQDSTNSLPTGFSHTRTIAVEPTSSRSPLRITLVWTDPPANPLVSIKLVNDLDLIVTNLAKPTEVYVGNYLADGGIYCRPLATNGGAAVMTTNFLSALDIVDNVENVFIPPPLTGPYSVTVRARRVNVNAVNAAVPDSVVQDYALVASVGSLVTNSTGLNLTAAFSMSSETNPVVRNYNTNYVVLIHERVGANPSYLSTTNGLPQQWNFYVFTNSAFGAGGTFYTNVAFATFQPYNVGFLTPNQANPTRPRAREADLDLFVSLNPALTNLDPFALGTAARSVGRFGSETVIYTNAPAGAVYYVGIKSEDQQAADYSFFALASEMPFSSMDSNGNQVVQGYPLEIPDGSPDQPGGTSVVAIAMFPMTIQRVTAELQITHELAGDLIANLSHEDAETGGEAFVVLNNHRVWYGTSNTLYDDSLQEDLEDAVTSDGPGSLNSFMGMEAQGLWTLDVVDNALQHTGRVDSLTLTISPLIDTNMNIGYPRTIGPQGWLLAVVDVPADATNLLVCVSATDAVDLYIRRGDYPTLSEHDMGLTNTTGGCLSWNIYTPVPPGPLQPGRYFIGVYNPTTTPVDVTLSVTVERNFIANPLVAFVATNAMPLFDDAMTNASIFVNQHGALAMIQVGVRIEHQRASDLALRLISPDGTRLLLAENRGWTNTLGYGVTLTNSITTNFLARVLDSSFEGMFGANPWWLRIRAGTNVLGWNVDSGEVDIVSDPQGIIGPSHTGASALDLNGLASGAISTNLATKAGTSYLLSFAYTKNPNGPTNVTADVKLGGSNVLTLAPSWANNVSNLNWQTTSVVYQAVGPVIKLEFVSTIAGNAGVYLDTVRMDEVQIVTNLFRYANFTEDTLRTTTPIKFGRPPYASTNLIFTNALDSGFETVRAANYTPADPPFEGWTVITNEVTVISNSVLAYAGTQCVALSSAVISNNIPTVPGHEYKLVLASRSSGIVSWWPGNGTAQDLTDGNDGILNGVNYGTAKVGQGFRLNAISTGVDVGNPSNLQLQDFTIETWIKRSSSTQVSLDIYGRGLLFCDTWGGYALGIATDGRFYLSKVGFSGEWSTATVTDTNFHHVAVSKAGSNVVFYVDGARGGAVLYDPGFVFNGPAAIGARGGDYVESFLGIIDEPSIYNRGLSDAEVFGIYHADTAGKVDPYTPFPNFNVELPGLSTNLVFASNNWSVFTLTFTAVASNTPLRLAGHPLGVLLDYIKVIDTGNEYYLPEEPLKPMFGQDIFGVWQLEVWDNRLQGQLTNASLISWELQLATQRTNAIPHYLTNHIATSTSVAGTDLTYFIVDACTNTGGSVTHTLTSSAPVDLIFNRFGLPTTTPGDAVLLAGVTNATNTLVIGGFPLLRPGRYFLAVRNTNPTTNTAFTLTADIACSTNAWTGLIGINKGSHFVAEGFKMEWAAPPSARFMVLYTDSLAGPWQTIPVVIDSSNGAFTFIDDGTHTGGMVLTNRFYRLLQLSP